MDESNPPDPASHERVRSIFLKVLDAAPEERDAVLEASCGSDGDVRREVEGLLGASLDADEVLWSLARRVRVPPGDANTGFFAEGRRLGAYRLLRQIGQGGMGAVYLAERADRQFEKQVAIKLLPLGLSTGTARGRFLAERQILAQLEHPGIARLLDAGIAEDGTPFFVMEYIDGEPIDRYCDRRSLGIAERIDLFLQVCAAVEYAHRNLVVHRDLKPGNILVTLAGAVKLLDFGIAKVLDADSMSGTTALTHQVGRPMTPAYASPEQVRGEPITTATDVYALGVLLYELLAGRAPYDVQGLSPTDLERLICTLEPIAPSAAALNCAAESATGGARISASATRRAHRLRGDLDTIVLMALRKEPDRRYRSATALADDLVLHRQGWPVSARPDRFAYRAGKFARRRPGILATAAAALLILAGFVSLLAAHAERLEVERNVARVEAARAEEERDRAESERVRATGAQALAEEERNRARWEYERAEAEAGRAMAAERRSQRAQSQAEGDRDRAEMEVRKAEQVTDFLVGLFEAFDPTDSRGENLSARQLLERGVAQAERLTGDPQAQADLFEALDRVHRSLGLYPQALTLAERALTLRRGLLGDEHPYVATSLNNLAEVLRLRGDFAGAEAYHRQALALRRKLFGEEHPEVAASLNYLGEVRRHRGDYTGAEAFHREALSLRRRLLGEEHGAVATSLNDLAEARRQQGDHEGAAAHHREALAMRHRLFGEEHPMVAASLTNLGLALGQKGDQEGAEAYHRQGLALWRKLLGEEHPAVAGSLNALAIALERRGDLEGAETYHRQALEMRQRLLGEDHPSVAGSLYNLGIVLRQNGDLAGAETHFRQALALWRSPLGEEHPSVTASLNRLGMVMREQGNLEGAEAYLREALETRRRLQDPRSIAESLENLGLLYRDQGEYEMAVSYLRAAIDVHHRVLGADHPDVATIRARLEDVVATMDPESPR
jgi:eukaryotic-like serine/threonine-protein kinase